MLPAGSGIAALHIDHPFASTVFVILVTIEKSLLSVVRVQRALSSVLPAGPTLDREAEKTLKSPCGAGEVQ
ncbi:MAG: hypothetical protein ACRDSP_18535 [Pseudonocardiaceae bacterium]